MFFLCISSVGMYRNPVLTLGFMRAVNKPPENVPLKIYYLMICSWKFSNLYVCLHAVVVVTPLPKPATLKKDCQVPAIISNHVHTTCSTEHGNPLLWGFKVINGLVNSTISWILSLLNRYLLLNSTLFGISRRFSLFLLLYKRKKAYFKNSQKM